MRCRKAAAAHASNPANWLLPFEVPPGYKRDVPNKFNSLGRDIDAKSAFTALVEAGAKASTKAVLRRAVGRMHKSKTQSQQDKEECLCSPP